MKQLGICGAILACLYAYVKHVIDESRMMDTFGTVLLVFSTLLMLTPLLQVVSSTHTNHNPFPIHHCETVPNSKKLQTTTEMWFLTLSQTSPAFYVSVEQVF